MAGLRPPLSTLQRRPREHLRMTRGQGGSLFLSSCRTLINYSLPVSWRTVLSPLPRHSHWRHCLAHPSSHISLPRKGRRVGPCIVIFEAYSAFTRVTARTLALPPNRGTLPEGFSHFVSSMTAPVASGWSRCRVGLAPTGKRRLCTAHTPKRK